MRSDISGGHRQASRGYADRRDAVRNVTRHDRASANSTPRANVYAGNARGACANVGTLSNAHISRQRNGRGQRRPIAQSTIVAHINVTIQHDECTEHNIGGKNRARMNLDSIADGDAFESGDTGMQKHRKRSHERANALNRIAARFRTPDAQCGIDLVRMRRQKRRITKHWETTDNGTVMGGVIIEIAQQLPRSASVDHRMDEQRRLTSVSASAEHDDRRAATVGHVIFGRAVKRGIVA